MGLGLHGGDERVHLVQVPLDRIDVGRVREVGDQQAPGDRAGVGDRQQAVRRQFGSRPTLGALWCPAATSTGSRVAAICVTSRSYCSAARVGAAAAVVGGIVVVEVDDHPRRRKCR